MQTHKHKHTHTHANLYIICTKTIHIHSNVCTFIQLDSLNIPTYVDNMTTPPTHTHTHPLQLE